MLAVFIRRKKYEKCSLYIKLSSCFLIQYSYQDSPSLDNHSNSFDLIKCFTLCSWSSLCNSRRDTVPQTEKNTFLQVSSKSTKRLEFWETYKRGQIGLSFQIRCWLGETPALPFCFCHIDIPGCYFLFFPYFLNKREQPHILTLTPYIQCIKQLSGKSF